MFERSFLTVRSRSGMSCWSPAFFFCAMTAGEAVASRLRARARERVLCRRAIALLLLFGWDKNFIFGSPAACRPRTFGAGLERPGTFRVTKTATPGEPPGLISRGGPKPSHRRDFRVNCRAFTETQSRCAGGHP